MPLRLGARSGAEPEPQWPPRSPHEALLSTPGGRERFRRLTEGASPSPSPSKRAPRPMSARSDSYNLRAISNQDDELDLGLDDDEDEETLELQLAAIQAKLKLKKFQAAKAKKAQESDAHMGPPESRSMLDVPLSSRAQSRTDGSRFGPVTRPQSQGEIQVPASPVRRAQTSQDTTSPSRVRLGIDKGLRAKDVSLKRAPSSKKTLDTEMGSQGGYLRRTNTPVSGITNQSSQERPKSFSERLAAARIDEQARRQRQQRVQQVRSKAFNLGQKEMEELKEVAAEIPEMPTQEEQYSREEVMAGNCLRRDAVTPSPLQQAQNKDELMTGQGTTESGAQKETRSRKPKISPSEVPEDEALAFEPYSGVHLKKRIIPHLTLTRNLASKKTYVIPDLLKHVKAPEFQLPDVEQDIVVFGIIGSKSDPKTHKNMGGRVKEKTEADPTRTKYMVFTLVDLKWEVELFLFNSGFDRYWKLSPGTLVAILNPTIMPPPQTRTDTGRFSLVINSGEDTILEIGVARDLGFCKSVKKDGALCSSWVNTKRTEFCEFHMNLALSKKRLARQDVNAFDTGLGPQKHHNSRRLHKWETHANDPGKKTRGNYDRDTQSAWFMRKATAASMLDNEVLGGEFGRVASTLERGEALRRRLATEEKERDLMKKLGEVGRGAGKEYMLTGQRSTKTGGANPSGTPSTDDPKPHLDAKSLGLISNKNSKIHLSPIKRKRGESVVSNRSESMLSSSASTSKATALGWGGGLKDKLTRMKEGEKLNGARAANDDDNGALPANEAIKDRSRSPARKKTRFVTEKGIREAGRESLGDELGMAIGTPQLGRRTTAATAMTYLDDDDDDELVILR